MKIIPVPILGVTGINGAGKTLYAVEIGMKALAQGVTVYSTVQIKFSRNGHTYESQPLLSLTQLLELRDCLVLLDEVSSIFSSRATSSLPGELITYLKALRHRNVAVLWTTPNWMDCDVQLRRITQACITWRPILRRPVKDSLHPRSIISLGSLLDTASVPTDKTPQRVLKRMVRLLPRSPAIGSYDSLADTPQIGRLLSTGPCPDCGGARAGVKCTPSVHTALGLPPVRDRVAVLAEILSVQRTSEPARPAEGD